MAAQGPTIWFDVEDLLDYVRIATRPSGIQRVCLELYAALHAIAPERIGFVRHDPLAGTLRVLPWAEVAAHCAPLHATPVAAPPSEPPPDPAAEPERGPLRRALRWLAWRLPPELRHPMGETAYAQIAALRGLGQAARALAAGRPQPTEAPMAAQRPELRSLARPGDVLAAFGSPWGHPDYAAMLDRCARPLGLRFAMLVHDLIPVMRPDFYQAGSGAFFRAYMLRCLPQADLLLTNSQATARDVRGWSAAQGLRLRADPLPFPFGQGFQEPPAPAALPQGLVPGGYALMVSTLEARKNHLLAFRAWRRLLEEMPAGRVPQLVFAGGVGWMVADLMQMLVNARNLDGRLTFVEKPDDATLAALYRGARFTLFPSLYEGWGLPVSESLAFGKVCLASASTSIPEAGGRFCLYHDPDSVTDAVALYRRAIEEPGLIAGMEAEIAATWRPTPWSASAAAVLAAVS